jgi:hypothetical protein
MSFSSAEKKLLAAQQQIANKYQRLPLGWLVPMFVLLF